MTRFSFRERSNKWWRLFPMPNFKLLIGVDIVCGGPEKGGFLKYNPHQQSTWQFPAGHLRTCKLNTRSTGLCKSVCKTVPLEVALERRAKQCSPEISAR